MLNLMEVLFGKPKHPPIPNVSEVREDTLYFDSLTRGVLISGNPGTGKTTWMAMEMLRYAQEYPERPIVCIDASSSVTNDFLELLYTLEPQEREALSHRIILDMPGDDRWVLPQPFFSDAYTLSDEDQVQRVVDLIQELNHEMLAQTPIMSASLKETAPELFRLISVITNEYGESWQLTEAKKLLLSYHEGGWLELACKKFGNLAPEAKWYFEHDFLNEDVRSHWQDNRTYALRTSLGVIEPKPLRARYGYPTPSYTMREVVDKGRILLVDLSRLVNQQKAQAWVAWDTFSSLRAIINKRIPHDPANKHVLLIMDEVYQLFRIPGMAREIGQISAYYRSRRLQLMMVIQALWQLDEKLKDQIWNLGNLVTFAMENFEDAYKISQQIFKYDPKSTKLPPASDSGQPIVEPDRGQYVTEANWIQNLKWRQIVMRRYLNERDKESFVSFVNRTRERPDGRFPAGIEDIKEQFLKRRAIPVREALELINKRKLTYQTNPNQRTTVNGK